MTLSMYSFIHLICKSTLLAATDTVAPSSDATETAISSLAAIELTAASLTATKIAAPPSPQAELINRGWFAFAASGLAFVARGGITIIGSGGSAGAAGSACESWLVSALGGSACES